MNDPIKAVSPPFLAEKSIINKRSLIYSLIWSILAVIVGWNDGASMDMYEQGIGLGAWGVLVGLSIYWPSFSMAALLAVAGASCAKYLYHGALTEAEHRFFLKYILASQAAISWMSMCYFLAFGSYALGSFRRSTFSWKTGSTLAWCATTLGLMGLLVRWYESYLYGREIGHIPISNLYEVIILFCLVTTWMYLYFEWRYRVQELGVWAMGVMSGWVVFLLWYAMTRQAQEIQPLVPALQSYWMKIHVPANFIGYGGFTVAAVVGAVILSRLNEKPGTHLLEQTVLVEWMYRSIAVGFAFFTIATILGAVWAAEAWGGYWSWDPKEVWALIVWLNYAAWLHFRLTRGQHTKLLAIWAVLGFGITLFAFLGVNMFLSGLHSYGKL
jgi:cytochrome c-type biogenesis protein CcsB